MIEILHHGAVNGVTGSCHELRISRAESGAMGGSPRRDRPPWHQTQPYQSEAHDKSPSPHSPHHGAKSQSSQHSLLVLPKFNGNL